MLGRKQSVRNNEDWKSALDHIEETVPKKELDSLVKKTVKDIKEKCKGKKAAYAWSAGKDSLVLGEICEKAGIDQSVLVRCNLEYPAFIAWIEQNKPSDLEIINTGQDMEWLKKHPDMLFPDKSNKAAQWFHIVQHRGQARYYKEHQLEILLLGRRKADGNYVGKDNIYTNSAGITRYSPLAEWRHEDILAYIHYYDVKLPPMDNLFEVAFATRNSQSIMSGCTGYYNRFYATVVENNVERIIISKSDANSLVVGSTVSIGNATALSGSNPTDDRGNAGLHAKANRVIITKIEDYDSNNSAVYVDNGGTKFSTGSTMVGSTEVKTTIVTMPWHTGACDNVLGSCGSPNSNTSGKDPYILFGVEMFLGFYEVISNVILKISNHVMTACICYDCTKLATSVTSDYVECGYSIADTQESWKYISELGYDPENPSVRHGTKVAASSSTGYADGQYTNKLDQTSDGLREWLSGGYLNNWSFAGRWYARLINGLGNGWWNFAARLSASGRCAKAAA